MTAGRKYRSSKAILAVCVAAIAPAGIAAAATWNGAGPDNNFTTPANWVGGAPPGSGESLVFDSSPRLTPFNDFAADRPFAGITFSPAAGAYVIGGNSITLAGDIFDETAGLTQTVNLPLVLDANRTVSVADTGSLVLGGVISGGFALTKTGAGTLTLGAANTYTGNTTVTAGALAYAADNANVAGLAFGVTPAAGVATDTAGALDLTNASVTTTGLTAQTATATPSTITIGTGKTLTVNGQFTVGVPKAYSNGVTTVTALNVSGERLVVNGGNTLFRVGLARDNGGTTGGDPDAFLDLSGLAHFSFQGTNHFRVGNGNTQGEMTLASASNSITASQVRIGDSGQEGGGTGGSENNNGGRGILRLGGGTNVINTDTLIIGRTKSAGTVQFQGATGTLSVAGAAGGATKANIQVGSSDNGSSGGGTSLLSLAGHDVTINAGNVVVGQLAGGSGGDGGLGAVTFDTGTFNIDSLRLAVNSSGTGPAATGTFTFGGDTPGSAATGVLNVANQFYLAHRTNTNAATGRSTGTFVMNGGNANINTDILDASTTVSTAGPNVTTFTIAGGTMNLNGHSIGSVAAPLTNINLSGGTLNNPSLIAGQSIIISPGFTLTGSPSYFIDNSRGAGLLDAAALGTITLPAGGSLRGGGSVLGNVVVPATAQVAVGSPTTADTLNFSGNLTLGNNSSVGFKLSETPGSGNDQVTVGGNLDVSAGTVNLVIEALGAGPQSGNTYTLFTYGGAPGLIGNQSNFAITSTLVDSRLSFSVAPTSSTPGAVNLVVGGVGALNLTWAGDVNNEWDLRGDANWRDPANAPQQFFTLDKVTFSDSSTNTNPVELVGELRPGAVTISATRNYTWAGTGGLVGPVGITKAGSGTLIVTNTNNHTGVTTIDAGVVQVGTGGSTGTLGSGKVVNNAVLAINGADGFVFPNLIEGLGEVRINGAGRTLLTAASTYSGATLVNSGTAVVTNATSLNNATTSSFGGVGGAVTVAPGAAIDVSGGAGANSLNFGAKPFFIAGTGVGGTGALTNSGTVAQQNVFQQVTLNADASVGGTGRFDIRAPAQGIASLDLRGFTLTKVGAGQFTLVGVSVGDGNIVVEGGVFAIETSSSVADNANGTTITYLPGTTAQFFNLNGAVTRPMVFEGDNTIGNASAANQPSTVGSNMLLKGDVTFNALNNAQGSLTVNGIISESGGPRSITKNGANSLILTNTNTYTGATTVNAGTLVVEFGSIASSSGVVVNNTGAFQPRTTQTVKALTVNAGGSAVIPADMGTTLTTNDLTVNAGGRVDINNNHLIVQSTAASATADLARVSSYAGDGYSAGGAAAWSASGLTSSRAAAIPPDLAVSPAGVAVIRNSDDGVTPLFGAFNGQPVDVNAILVKLAYYGDTDLNGVVDGEDYTRADRGFLSRQDANPGNDLTGYRWGDFNHDGKTNISDYFLIDMASALQAGPLDSAAGPAAPVVLSAAGSPVPEPAALGLLALAAPALLRRRRRA